VEVLLVRQVSARCLATAMSRQQPKVLSPDQIPAALPKILEIGRSHFVSQCLHSTCTLGVPDVIGNGKLSVEQIAAGLPRKVNKEFLARAMRMLALSGIYEETAGPDGKCIYSLTANGALLQTKAPQPSAACGMIHWMAKPMWDAWLEVPNVVAGTSKGTVPFDVANGMPLFEYYEKHPESAKPFNEFMTFCSAGELHVVLEHGGWDKLSGKTVVDVGGNYGGVMGAVAAKFPEVKCVSFDLPEVIEKAGKPPAGVEFAKGDMFNPSTLPKCDVIFMKHIIHDWSDDDTVKILKSCYAALPADGKVMLAEPILPPAGQITKWDATGLHMDVLMLTIGGKERTRKMFDELAKRANFRVVEEKQTGHPVCRILILGKK
jgi:caffeic acid 3-O-methyltransferase